MTSLSRFLSFSNPLLLFGAAAFLIPLIIHILNRSRFRTVEWGAMHLLESVIKVNHKKFHIEQILLLLIRCAIPVLLALCLARPVLKSTGILAGDAPVSLVILLDTSYSMDAVGDEGSGIDRAVEAATSILAAAPRGSEVAVIRTGGKPTPLFDQPVFDPEAVIRRLRQVQGGYGAGDMQAAVDEALSTLSEMTNARREMIVISDFQKADWDVFGSDTLKSIRHQAEAMAVTPHVSLMPVAVPATGNISIDSLDFPRRPFGVGQQMAVRAGLRNHGDSAVNAARVVLKIDGQETNVSQISLSPNGSTQTLFPCEFDAPGSHVIEVSVVADDPLPTDNRFAAAVTIWDRMNILLVDGDPGTQPLESETDFLSVALTPYTFGRVRLTDLVETKTILPRKIDKDTLATARVVVLANVSKLNDQQLADLTDYVQHGGALLVCAGDRIDLNWYREKMFSNGIGLLPTAFGARQGKIDDQGQASRIVAQHFDHPALEFFNDPANGDLSTAEIRQWYQLSDTAADTETGEDRPDPSGAVVMARLAAGDPLLVERRFGDGVVVQMATACDADWSDLPMRPFFVPLMQQLVTTMASRISPPRNIVTGEPAAALFSLRDDTATQDGDSSAAAENQNSPVPQTKSQTVTVVTPDGSRRTLQTMPQGTMQLARFDATQRPGVYSMSLPDTETIHFVAESSRSESELDFTDEDRMKSLADGMNASVVQSAAQYLEEDKLRRHGRDIWKYVLGGLLAFMFLEVVLQQRFARVRP